MSDNNSIGDSKCGYLSVKLCYNLWPIVANYRLWSKRWIRMEATGDGDEHSCSVRVRLYRRHKSGQNIIFEHMFRPQNTAIYRSRSRSQNFSFTICDNNEPIIHLATNSETDTQLWMQWFRYNLWIPNALMQIDSVLKRQFYASIIDNEWTHRSGLLGAYGYLQLSAVNIVLIHCQTGHVLHEWLTCDNTLTNPSENVLQITRNSCQSGYSGLKSVCLYCLDANEVIKRVNRNKELQMNVKCVAEPEGLSLNNSSFSTKNTNDFRNKIDRNFQKSNYDFNITLMNTNVNTFRIRNAKEIPETMLNCSITSSNDWQLSTNEMRNHNIYCIPFDTTIDSDLYQEIDQIYEEILNQDINENINYSHLCQIKDNYHTNNIFSSHDLPIKPLNDSMGTGRADRYTDCCDMFSQIVKQTNTSLINSRRYQTKPLDVMQVVAQHQFDNHYYEMRAVLSESPVNRSNHLSDFGEYVDMKSFSI